MALRTTSFKSGYTGSRHYKSAVMADDPGKGDSGYNQQNQLGNDMNEETAHSPNKSAFVNGTEVAYNNITISDKITIEHHIRVIPMVPVVDSHGSNINFKEELQRESLHVSVLKGEEITDEEDEEDDEEDWISDDGVESDVEDNLEIAFPLRKRESNPQLPETVTALDTPHGCKVYVVGTAHFSTESQDDVSKVIRAVQPDVVMVELCKSRINILELDEAMLLEEAKNINLEKFRLAIKQSGVVQGMMHLLLLSMSAHLTKQLGMAPGGEFRRAFQEAKKVPGCRLHLGDRPIQITLKRALGALSVWQKMKLAWYLITSKDPISKEDVEKCKQRDLLEQLLKEMTGEFPALSRVFVDERDIYLTHSLKTAAQPRDTLDMPEGFVPTVVVGVVGIGHVPGIISNWNKDQDIREIMIIPPGTVVGTVLRWSIRASLLGIFSYGCYRFFRWTAHVFWK